MGKYDSTLYYLDKSISDDNYDINTRKALRDWLGTNNFEVKEREDDYMWGSLFRLIVKKMKG